MCRQHSFGIVTMLVRINATEQLLAQLHVVERFYGLVPIGIDFLVLRTIMMI